MKMKTHRYDINRLRSSPGDKYGTYNKCFTLMMLIYAKQHLKLNS